MTSSNVLLKTFLHMMLDKIGNLILKYYYKTLTFAITGERFQIVKKPVSIRNSLKCIEHSISHSLLLDDGVIYFILQAYYLCH